MEENECCGCCGNDTRPLWVVGALMVVACALIVAVGFGNHTVRVRTDIPKKIEVDVRVPLIPFPLPTTPTTVPTTTPPPPPPPPRVVVRVVKVVQVVNRTTVQNVVNISSGTGRQQRCHVP